MRPFGADNHIGQALPVTGRPTGTKAPQNMQPTDKKKDRSER